MKIKSFILAILLFALLPLTFVGTACSQNNTMTVFYNEMTYNSSTQTTEIRIKIKNNSNNQIELFSKDFSLNSTSGHKSATYFTGGNINTYQIKLNPNEISSAYLLFEIPLSDITNQDYIYYLGQKVDILKENTIKIQIG